MKKLKKYKSFDELKFSEDDSTLVEEKDMDCNYFLIVKSNFDGYQKGNVIYDKDKVMEIITGPKKHMVLKLKKPPMLVN